MGRVKIGTVKQLKDLIKDLPDNYPIGKYYPNYWVPEFVPGTEMSKTDSGLAVEIDYSYNY